MASAVHDLLYMGSVALPSRSAAAGFSLGVLQQPLLDLYVTYVPASAKTSVTTAARQLPERRLTLTERGIIISNVSTSRRQDCDEFYAMPTVIFWEVVRSV